MHKIVCQKGQTHWLQLLRKRNLNIQELYLILNNRPQQLETDRLTRIHEIIQTHHTHAKGKIIPVLKDSCNLSTHYNIQIY